MPPWAAVTHFLTGSVGIVGQLGVNGILRLAAGLTFATRGKYAGLETNRRLPRAALVNAGSGTSVTGVSSSSDLELAANDFTPVTVAGAEVAMRSRLTMLRVVSFKVAAPTLSPNGLGVREGGLGRLQVDRGRHNGSWPDRGGGWVGESARSMTRCFVHGNHFGDCHCALSQQAARRARLGP